MRPLIVTHCGAGSDRRVQDLAEKSAQTGYEILRRGGTALDAVEEAIVVLEDNPRSNAGIGSRRRVDGTVQMDASIMDSDLNSGAVAAIMNVRNPIRVARLVMKTPHLILAADGAVLFARKRGVPYFNPATAESEGKWRQTLEKIKRGDVPKWAGKWKNYEIGDTVGAVARDNAGRYAAGNSSGGTSLMLPGRVGDSPIVGAGLYAGKAGAVTVTGVGEEIIRHVLSKFVYDSMEDGDRCHDACTKGLSLYPKIVPMGLIAVDGVGWGEACNTDMAYAVAPDSRKS